MTDTQNESSGLQDETTPLLQQLESNVRILVNPSGTSWYVSVFLVVNAALGAGLLNFPAAYNQSGGLVISITIQAVLLAFVFGSLIILTYCSDLHQSATYQDVIYSLCGKRAQVACSFAVMAYSFGTCITFLIIIGDQWDKFLTFSYGEDYCKHWYMSRTFTMVISSVILILPLCYPRRIDFLKYVSVLGVLAVVYCVVLVTVKYFVVGKDRDADIKTRPDHWTDVFIVVPVICFGYQCHLSVVPIYSCMKKRTVCEFTKTLVVAMVLCVFAYTGTASFGYLTFGSAVNEDVLLSYKPTPDVLVAVILVAIKMYTTLPILLFVGRAALESVWIQGRGLQSHDIVRFERRRRVVMVTLWFASSLLIAVVIPNIGIVISLLGGLAALFAFSFPGLCLLQVLQQNYIHPQQHKYRYSALLALSFFYIISGVFVFGLVTTQSIMDDVKTHTKHSGISSRCP